MSSSLPGTVTVTDQVSISPTSDNSTQVSATLSGTPATARAARAAARAALLATPSQGTVASTTIVPTARIVPVFTPNKQGRVVASIRARLLNEEDDGEDYHPFRFGSNDQIFVNVKAAHPRAVAYIHLCSVAQSHYEKSDSGSVWHLSKDRVVEVALDLKYHVGLWSHEQMASLLKKVVKLFVLGYRAKMLDSMVKDLGRQQTTFLSAALSGGRRPCRVIPESTLRAAAKDVSKYLLSKTPASPQELEQHGAHYIHTRYTLRRQNQKYDQYYEYVLKP